MASWKPCRKLDESEKALRIICKIGLRNGERGERVAGDDDDG